ncbi:hypothetical protein ACTL6U_16475 [Rhodovibrionaceae bacterium A322]
MTTRVSPINQPPARHRPHPALTENLLKIVAPLFLLFVLAACNSSGSTEQPVSEASAAQNATRSDESSNPNEDASLQSPPPRPDLDPFPGAALPADGLGRFYFYRTADPMLVGVEPDIIVNDKKVGVSRASEIFYRDAKPGRYRIHSTHDPDVPILVSLLPGQIRYIRTSPQLRFLGMRIGPQLIDPRLATQETKNLFVSPQE